MNRIICTIALVAASSVPGYPHPSPDNSVAQTCGYTEIYKKKGWTIPGVDGAKKMWRVAGPGRKGVYMTKLEPVTRAATIQSVSCSREHPGRLEMEDAEIQIIGLSSFGVDGRNFAYNLIYEIDGIAVEWNVTFYDLDGSGHFTLRRGETSRVVPDLLPDWVRESTATK